MDAIAMDYPWFFQIPIGFNTYWREQQWKIWKLTNILMIISHSLMLIISGILFIAIIRAWKLYTLINCLLVWFILMIYYLLMELGVNCWQFSWYGWKFFRQPVLCFLFIWWVLRDIINCIFLLVVISYWVEVYKELHLNLDDGMYEDYEYRGTMHDPYAPQPLPTLPQPAAQYYPPGQPLVVAPGASMPMLMPGQPMSPPMQVPAPGFPPAAPQPVAPMPPPAPQPIGAPAAGGDDFFI
jgi:hypothetical protein